ncbi:MAG: twin-arginine translocase TatA/TatE family subunit [Pirellulales bacterium]
MLAFITGFWEIAILLVVVLLLFGGSRLPALARSLGQSIVEFKKGVKEIGDHSAESDPDRHDR